MGKKGKSEMLGGEKKMLSAGWWTTWLDRLGYGWVNMFGEWLGWSTERINCNDLPINFCNLTKHDSKHTITITKH